MSDTLHDGAGMYSLEVNYSGQLCFLCETEGAANDGHGRNQHRLCPLCPSLLISAKERGVLLNHIGAHILHDPRIDRNATPCGFCLSSGDACAIYVKRGKGAKSGDILDMQRTRCPSKYKLSIARTSTSTLTSPCTNVPLRCPYCPKGSPAVWKYNMPCHLRRAHRLDPEAFASIWKPSTSESESMKKLLDGKPRDSKRKRKMTKAAKTAEMVSEAHVCKIALRYVYDDSQLYHKYLLGP